MEWINEVHVQTHNMLEEIKENCVSRRNDNVIFCPEEFGLNNTSEERSNSKTVKKAIQKAIDAAYEAGGGTVILKSGDYVSGTIVLRSNVTLKISENSRLFGSLDLEDYEEHVAKRRTVQDTNMGMNQSLIFAEGCENIAICGKGIIDGRGTQTNFPGEETVCGTPGRPFLIRIIDCTNISVEDITLKDAACWMQNYLNCENLLMDNVKVENAVNFNNDGIDVDGCRKVWIRDCHVVSGDDAMCFKGASQRNNEKILVENCEFYSSCNTIKIGTDTQGDFRNIWIRNCIVGGTTEDMRHIKALGADSGVSLEMVDGGTVENIYIQNIQMSNVRSPIFIRMDDRGRVKPEEAKPPVGTLRNIILEDIKGTDCGPWGSYFLGYETKCIENVLLKNIRIEQIASQKPVLKDEDFEEMHNWYPDAHMVESIGDPPAYGLWVRHGKNIILDNYEVISDETEKRPEIVAVNDASIFMVTE